MWDWVFSREYTLLFVIFPAAPTARHPVQTPGTNPTSNRFRCYTVRGQGGVRRTNGLT